MSEPAPYYRIVTMYANGKCHTRKERTWTATAAWAPLARRERAVIFQLILSAKGEVERHCRDSEGHWRDFSPKPTFTRGLHFTPIRDATHG